MLALTTRRTLQVIGVVLALLLLVIGGVAISLRTEYAGVPEPWAKSTGHDAVWLGHAWVDGRRTSADIDKLSPRLSSVRDVYVHTGPYSADGTLRPNLYPVAATFVKDWKVRLPNIRLQAWLGQTVNPADKGHADLADPAARARMVAGAKALVDLGYDGIHYDFEPVPSGDPSYLALMRETRAAIGPAALLSVATQQIRPYPLADTVFSTFGGHPKYWTQEYFAAMAGVVNQVAIMTYDSWTPLQQLYGGHVARQTRLALDVLPDKTDLLIGAPAYHDHMVGVVDYAESVAMAGEGLRIALSEHGKRVNVGLALYVDFAATEEDWREYRDHWVLDEPSV